MKRGRALFHKKARGVMCCFMELWGQAAFSSHPWASPGQKPQITVSKKTFIMGNREKWARAPCDFLEKAQKTLPRSSHFLLLPRIWSHQHTSLQRKWRICLLGSGQPLALLEILPMWKSKANEWWEAVVQLIAYMHSLTPLWKPIFCFPENWHSGSSKPSLKNNSVHNYLRRWGSACLST